MTNAKILVVDDEESMRSLLKITLTRHGFSTVIAKDGREALDIVKGQEVDLILSDVAMPDMNGYQLYEEIRQSTDIRRVLVPFVFLTARNMASDIRYGKGLGVDDYLVKPIVEADLVTIIHGKVGAFRRTLEVIDQQGNREDEFTFEVGGQLLVVNRAQHRAWVGDEEISIPTRAMFLLERLIETPDKVVTASELIKTTHSINATEAMDIGALLRPLVRRLRAPLINQGLGWTVQNVRGIGYMFVTANTL